jgi:hypothetical protein
MRLRRFLPALLLAATAPASLVRVEILERADAPAGYERLTGKAYFAVDPRLAANRIIADIDLAPRNERGMVEFSADLCLVRPRDPKTGNGTLLFEVSNRGGKALKRFFDLADDNFLLEQGYTLAWIGWQPDVPRTPGLLRLHAPAAKGVTGRVRSEFIPDVPTISFSLADRNMEVIYPVAGAANAELTVRDGVEGARQAIPRDRWTFEGGVRVVMPAGFEPGRIYEAVYQAQDPVIVGLGPAAVRDFVSYLKHEDRRLPRAIGFGISQSGRFLRTMLYYGFNQDEQGRQVFDGVMAHVAGGGRGSFNIRFGQPSRDAHPFLNLFYPTDLFPFTDLDETDAETGLKGGILVRAAPAPKIFYTNSSYEYYGRAASLIHITPDGREDAPLAPDTRIYVFAGGQHGPAPFPPPGRKGTRNLTSPNDYRWSMRALLGAMNAWITSNKQPPASRYPRIDRRELAPLAALRFPKIPGVELPTRIHLAYRVDYGAEPPKVGKPFPMLVPQVDADGNETAGVCMPEVAVPLATYTGWNLRDPSIGAPEELFSMAGSWIPFARTRGEREKSGDPRPSVEERYKTREDYLARIGQAARELVRGGYLLEPDIPALLERAGREWSH